MKRKDGKAPNRFLTWSLIGIAGAPLSFSPMVFYVNKNIDSNILECNKGSKDACEQLLDYPSSYSRITSTYFKGLKIKAEQEEKRKAEEDAKRKEQEVADEAKRKLEQAAEDAKRKDQKIADDARKADLAIKVRQRKEQERLDKINAEAKVKAGKKLDEWARSTSPFVGCKTEAKGMLRDPGSYQDDWVRPQPIINHEKETVSFTWPFRAKNGFGGYTPGVVNCVTRLDKDGSRGGFGIPEASLLQ